MRRTTVKVTTTVNCDRCGVTSVEAVARDMGSETFPLLSLTEQTRQAALDGYTQARIGHGSPLLDLCEPCLRLVKTALTPTNE